jgi:hypothetical protein
MSFKLLANKTTEQQNKPPKFEKSGLNEGLR